MNEVKRPNKGATPIGLREPLTLNRLHWRRIRRAYRQAGVDIALYDAHRIKMIEAGWSV